MTVGLFALIAALAIAGAAAGVSSRQPPQNQQGAEKSEPQESHEAGGEDQGRVVSWRDLWHRTLNEPIALFTGFLALFSFGLLAVAFLQIILLLRSEDVARESAEAAKQSAEATGQAVRLAEQNAERQLRAYVTLSDGHVRIINNGEAIEATVQFRNSGQTPGYQFSTFARFRVQAAELDPPYDEVPPPEERSGFSIIGSGQHVNVTFRLNLAPEHTPQSIRDRANIVYIWGEASYPDAFGREWAFVFRSLHGTEVDATTWLIGPHKLGYEERERNKQ